MRIYEDGDAFAELERRESNGQPIGWSGTELAGGYFTGVDPNAEIDNDAWLGDTSAPGFGEQMAKEDGEVGASVDEWMEAVQNAPWTVQPGDADDPQQHMMAEFIRRMLFEVSETSWETNSRHLARSVLWGCSPSEIVTGYVSDDETPVYEQVKEPGRMAKWTPTGQFDRGHYVLTDLAPRSPASIERWLQDKETGRFAGIEQIGRMDDTTGLGTGNIEIPADRLVLVTYGGDSGNWQGVSRYRPAYILWKARKVLLRMHVIAAERFGVGVPNAKVVAKPGEVDDKTLRDNWASVKRMVARYRGGSQAWIATPYGIDVDIMDTALPAADAILKLYQALSTEIHIIGQTQHLVQGTQSGSGGLGTQGLRDGQSSDFRNTINPLLDSIARETNRRLVKPLIDLNWEGVRTYPFLQVGDAAQQSVKEQLEAYEIGVRSRALTPQPEDEDFFRQESGLPVRVEVEAEEEPDEDPDDDTTDEPEQLAECACGCGGVDMFADMPFEAEQGRGAERVRQLAESKFDDRSSRVAREDAITRISVDTHHTIRRRVLEPYLEKIAPALASGDAAAIARTPLPGKPALVRTLRDGYQDVRQLGKAEVKRETKRMSKDPDFAADIAEAMAEWAQDNPSLFADNPSGQANSVDDIVRKAGEIVKKIGLIATTTASMLFGQVDATINSYLQQVPVNEWVPSAIMERVQSVITPRTIASDAVIQDSNSVYSVGRAEQGRIEGAGTVVYTVNPEIGISGPHVVCVECEATAASAANPAEVGTPQEEQLMAPNPLCLSTLSGVNNCWCTLIYLSTTSTADAADAAGLA